MTSSMTNRQRINAILHYQDYDRLPIVHFGFWKETLAKWAQEGHLSQDLADNWWDGGPADVEISKLLGFDTNWYANLHPATGLSPTFDPHIVKEFPDGSKHVMNTDGVVVLQRPEAGSIPGEIEHTLVDRASWEEHYKWRYQFQPERVDNAHVLVNDKMVPVNQGGAEFLRDQTRDYHYGVFCGSLYGQIRNVIGVEGTCYLQMDDPELFDEIIDTVADLCYKCVEGVLATGAKFDFGHFWEDICFKNGPLISPKVFDAKVGPHYKRITDLLRKHDIDIVSLDCDGKIDALVPTWVNNGVNTMFPIEVGTWDASIAPWREQFGKEIRGVGGMNKTVFARDKAAIDQEVQRLKPLVELGGFIPCPDHRIAPDAKWDLVLYYTEKMRQTF
ncbi:MAG: hypothetical protein JW936_05050 [Sedimentisphaerales bacterium]|nr:hypothetical protein [Sedimentisphaerales bacterium]